MGEAGNCHPGGIETPGRAAAPAILTAKNLPSVPGFPSRTP
jgi:hypothetical protein